MQTNDTQPEGATPDDSRQTASECSIPPSLAAGADRNQEPEPGARVAVSRRRGLVGVGGERLIPLAQARKFMADWLDAKRPWAHCQDGGVYEMMEEIVDYAAFAFRGERRPTKEEVADLNRDLLRFTADLDSHPENYEGPCACAECRSYGD